VSKPGYGYQIAAEFHRSVQVEGSDWTLKAQDIVNTAAGSFPGKKQIQVGQAPLHFSREKVPVERDFQLELKIAVAG